MGSNESGQLGLGDVSTSFKYSPVLIESMMDKDPVQVQCGENHTIVLSQRGKCYAWGSNENGQCGVGSNQTMAGDLKVFTPRQV